MIAANAGFRCLICGGTETIVKDSRAYLDGWRRRRQCPTCGPESRFSTLEVAQNLKQGPGNRPMLRVMKLLESVDKLPAHKQEIVLNLIAAFAKEEPL